MKTIFWKEIRENAKWAALGLAIFALGLAYAWAKTTDPYQYYEAYSALLAPAVLMVTTLGSAIIGGALGLLQIIPEQARDRWAFLVHRPVSLASIFWGKCLAGIVLYLAATLPPFLVLGWWVSQPGNLPAPFEWRMALAGLSDIFCGVIFYLAGLLTGVRKGRWWGSRALAIPAAIFLLFFLSRQMEFLHAALWYVPVFFLFLLAARAGFLGNGEYPVLRAWGRILTFVLLFYGTLQLLSWCQGLVGFAARRGGDRYSGMEYKVLKNGTPVKVFNKDGAVERLETLDGKPVELPPEKLASLYNETLREGMISSGQAFLYREPFRSISRYTYQLGNYGNSMWYFVRRRAVFEEYNRVTATHLGSLTQSGFITGAAVPARGFEGIPAPTNKTYYQMLSPIYGGTVFLVELLSHKVTVIFRGSADQAPLAATRLMGDNNSERTHYVGVGLADRLKIFDGSGANLFDVPFAHDPKVWNQIEPSVMPDGSRFFLFFAPDYRAQSRAGGKLPTYFEEYSRDGTRLSQRELPGRPTGPAPFRAWSVFYGSMSPVVLKGYSEVMMRWKQQPGDVQPIAVQWKKDVNYRAGWLASLFAGLLSAGFTALRMRGQRLPFSIQTVWLGTVFLTGFAGLLAFIAARPNVARVPCAGCGAGRLVDRERCEHCEKEWAAAPSDGTEIWAASH